MTQTNTNTGDACDIDVESIAMWIHDETRDVSRFTHSQGSTFIPIEIRPPVELSKDERSSTSASGVAPPAEAVEKTAGGGRGS